MDLVLFGIQGSGKGTLGKIIAAKLGFDVFETGNELRKLAGENSELGQKVKSIVEAGHLVPNDVVMDIIENFMKSLATGKRVIFDGIPRKLVQAETFDALMQKLGRQFTAILIDVPEEVAVKRLATRRICSKCKTVFPGSFTGDKCSNCGGELVTRTDDNPESIRTRVKAYYDETTPVIERYKKSNRLLVMNGNQSIEEAGKEILEVIEKNLKNKL
jgi:adenylate kinase